MCPGLRANRAMKVKIAAEIRQTAGAEAMGEQFLDAVVFRPFSELLL